MVNFLGHVSRGPKEILALKVLKNPKGGPFYVKKKFCLRFRSNFMCEIPRPKGFRIMSFIKIGDKKFFFPKGGPFDVFSDFPILNFLKNSKGGPFYVKNVFVSDFHET